MGESVGKLWDPHGIWPGEQRRTPNEIQSTQFFKDRLGGKDRVFCSDESLSQSNRHSNPDNQQLHGLNPRKLSIIHNLFHKAEPQIL